MARPLALLLGLVLLTLAALPSSGTLAAPPTPAATPAGVRAGGGAAHASAPASPLPAPSPIPAVGDQQPPPQRARLRPGGSQQPAGVVSSAQPASSAQSWATALPLLPPGRSSAGMAYDAASGAVVLFGGCCDGGGYLNDMWSFGAGVAAVPAAITL